MKDYIPSSAMRIIKKTPFILIAAIAVLLSHFIFCHKTMAVSYTDVRVKLVKTIHVGKVSNSTTITSDGSKRYFIYTDGTFNGLTRFYRCNWPQLTGCKKILEADTDHSNIIDAPWRASGPSKYFWVFGAVANKSPRWCIDSVTGAISRRNPATCGGAKPLSANWNSASARSGSGSHYYTQYLTQDATKYGSYFLRVYGGFGNSGGNIIEVLKDGQRIKTLRPKSSSGQQIGHEAEGVFVDGDTGTIYFTTIDSRNYLRIYKITDRSLPILTKNAVNSSSSSSGSSGSTTSGGYAGSSGSAGSAGSQSLPKDANCVKTSIIGSGGEYCDDGKGSGVYTILNIAITILTFGVGIAATAGLIICGIKYATSGTNEAQATNARRRIFEIVIGLIAYALMYLALQWLIPGFG